VPLIHQAAIDVPFEMLDLHLLAPGRYPHLLESSAPGPQGRYDILFAFPGESIALRALDSFDFLAALDAAWKSESCGDTPPVPVPFYGGWFLYLGYELAGQIEPTLKLPADAAGLPIACATRFPAAVIVDRRDKLGWIVSEQLELIDRIFNDISRLRRQEHQNSIQRLCVSEDDPQQFLRACLRILDYIRDGDVFQVNLSRQWCVDWPVSVPTADIYRRLRSANPGPFSGMATWGSKALLCSSPERLVEVRGSEVQTRPIAGTRPRGAGCDADQAFSNELMAHPKERAEHVMLIDLERNDLGRIAVPGSVSVSELMALESYATVHHIVSNIHALMRPDITPAAVIRAMFPGGTITGCPKIRCMEIIAELETTGRGAYTGSMGYLNRDGNMDLNILIRTMVRNGEQLRWRAGAGIVAESSPELELEETRAKARGMLAAINVQGT
jgi:anthranilate synthase component 1